MAARESEEAFHWARVPRYRELGWQAARLVSFDVFDTILHRAARAPADVFLEVGRRALSLGLIDPAISPEVFQQLRIRIERLARNRVRATRPSGEVTLAEIWAAAPDFMAHREALAELELEIEYALSFSNPYTISLLRAVRASGRGVCFTSDTYFSSDFVARLLGKAGLDPSEYDAVIVSCEHDANKSSGTLFDIIQVRFQQVPASDMLHIGDDVVADFTQPRRKGLSACHLDTIHLEHDLAYRNLLLGVERHEDAAAMLPRLGRFTGAEGGGDEAIFDALGASRVGPALALFCLWVMRDAATRGVRMLCPIMREAHLFGPMLHVAAEALGVDIEVRPLYASRRATWLPAMRTLDSRAIARLRERRGYSLSAFVAELELPMLPPELEPERDTPFGEVVNKGALSAYLAREDVQTAARERSAAQRGLLKAYVEGVVGDCEHVAFVDLGANGHTLVALADSAELRSRLVAHYLLMAVDPAFDNLANGAFILPWLGSDALTSIAARALVRSHEPLEVLLTTRHKTTLGYVAGNNGSASPVLGPELPNSSQCQRLERFERAALEAMRHLAHMARNVGVGYLTSVSTRVAAGLALLRLIELPDAQEARSLGDLVFDDNAGASGWEPICDARGEMLARAVGVQAFLADERRRWGYGGRGVRWPQGTVTRLDSGLILSAWRATFNDTEHRFVCSDLIDEALRGGVTEVVVYGAGKVGFEMVQLARQLGLDVRAVVDSDTTLHGTLVAGAPVTSLASAARGGGAVFLVASVAYAGAIRDTIQRFHADLGLVPPVIHSAGSAGVRASSAPRTPDATTERR
jgi:FMN phosphatase YigB (HAD superfamily)